MGLTAIKCHTHLQNSKYISVSEHVDHFSQPKNTNDEDAEGLQKQFIEEINIEYVKASDVQKETKAII